MFQWLNPILSLLLRNFLRKMSFLVNFCHFLYKVTLLPYREENAHPPDDPVIPSAADRRGRSETQGRHGVGLSFFPARWKSALGKNTSQCKLHCNMNSELFTEQFTELQNIRGLSAVRIIHVIWFMWWIMSMYRAAHPTRDWHHAKRDFWEGSRFRLMQSGSPVFCQPGK